MDVSSCFLFFLLISSVPSLILPLTKPNGDADLSSLINHVTMLETQVQTTNSKLQAIEIELTTVKDKLQTTEDELKVVKADLSTAKTDIAILKHDLQKGPDPVELTNLKSEFETLKLSNNSNAQQINLTVIDSLSRDVRSNMREIQSLNTRQNNTEKDLTTTKSEVQTAVSDVKTVQSQVNSISGDVNTLSQQVKGVKNQIETDQTKQNITDQDLTATKALVQSTSAEVKSIKSQVNSVSGDLNAVIKDLAVIKNRTDIDVAFQVTLRGLGWFTAFTTLIFDTVDYNTVDGYNQTSGVFTAPVNGTYIFWANVQYRLAGKYTWTYIIKGQQKLAQEINNNNNAYGVTSIMAVTRMDQGDEVHFTTNSESNEIGGEGDSSFGGALLNAV